MTIKNPIIADNKPVNIQLNKGQEYHFCTCGKSRSQPLCDGSHTGTSFTPRVIIPSEDTDAWLCACKHSRNKPFCDGSHQHFSDDQIGREGPGISADETDIPPARATDEEPTLEYIHQLAENGLETVGHHGPVGAMGVPGGLERRAIGPASGLGGGLGASSSRRRPGLLTMARVAPWGLGAVVCVVASASDPCALWEGGSDPR